MPEARRAPDRAPTHRLPILAGSAPRRLRTWFSSGSTLPYDVWAQRHRWILLLLWLHVPGVFVFALVRGNAVGHSAVEASLVGAFAVAATLLHRERRLGHRRDVAGPDDRVGSARASRGRVDRDALPLLRDGRSGRPVPGLVAVRGRDRVRRSSSTASPERSTRRASTTTRRRFASPGSGPRFTVGSSSR